MPVSGVTCLQFHASCRAAANAPAQAHARSLLAAGGKRTRLTSPAAATLTAPAPAPANLTAPKPTRKSAASSLLQSLLRLRAHSPQTHRFKNSTPCTLFTSSSSRSSSSSSAHARTLSLSFTPTPSASQSQPSSCHLNNSFSEARRAFRELSEFHHYSRKASLRRLEPSYAPLSTTPNNSFLRTRFLTSSSLHRGICSPPLISAAMSTLSQPQTPAALDSPLREQRYRPVERLTDCLETPSLDDRSYRVIRLPPNQLEVLLVHDAETDKASAAMDVNVGNFSDEEDMSGMVRATEDMTE